jgi:NB-ARC domain
MVQSTPDPKRYRGYVLTLIGLEKLQAAIQILELETGVRQNSRAIAERVQLIAPDGLHPMTVRKILRGQQGVDMRSIDHVCAALQIPLETRDYAHASLYHGAVLGNAIAETTQVRTHFSNHLEKNFESIVESNFYGRVEEKIQLRQQILVQQCRLIAVLGVAGMGKTVLVKSLTSEVESAFECLVWKSLSPAPCLTELLAEILRSLLEQLGKEPELPTTLEGLTTELIKLLQHHRCLLVLDGLEAILGNRPVAGYYREGYEAYGELFRAIAESCHVSCLIFISQEKPRGFRRLENPFVHLIQLQGLNGSDSQKLLQSQGVFTSRLRDWHDLVDYYGGNPLLLNLSAAQIRDYFDGSISEYLSKAQGQGLFQDARDLLEQQFSRISHLEERVMIYLAMAEGWVSLGTMQADLNPVLSCQELLDVLDSLHHRSLFQKSGTDFKLPAFMAEFIKNGKEKTGF